MRYRTTGGNDLHIAISSADISPSNWTWVLIIRVRMPFRLRAKRVPAGQLVSRAENCME